MYLNKVCTLIINTTTLQGQEITFIPKYIEVIWSSSLDKHTSLVREQGMYSIYFVLD